MKIIASLLSLFFASCSVQKLISYTNHLQHETKLIKQYIDWEKTNSSKMAPACLDFYHQSKQQLLDIIDDQSQLVDEIIGLRIAKNDLFRTY